MRITLALLVGTTLVTGCNAHDEPRPAPTPPPAAPVPAVAPTAAALDPVRVEAEKGNRDALDRMTSSIGCPQQLPSQFARFCLAAADFAKGTSDELAQGDTILVGEAAIIEAGPPSVSTLGTGMPVVFLLRRKGAVIEGKQLALRETDERDAMPTVLGRIGKAIDGKWDHVDVPASFADQIKGLSTATLDPLETADGAIWPKDMDGMELRRANGRWMLVGAPEGAEGSHVITIFADKLKVLGAKEKSPQKITILHL